MNRPYSYQDKHAVVTGALSAVAGRMTSGGSMSTRRSDFVRAGVVLAAAVLLMGSLGCSSSDDTNATSASTEVNLASPQAGGALTYGITDESTGWSPQNDRWSPGSFNVARAIFDPLVVAGEDGELQPWLAESVTPQNDAQAWTIKMRQGISFSNGEAVNADAVVANLQAFKDSPLTTFGFTPITGIAKVDDYTVRLTLDQPWVSLPVIFTGQGGMMVAPAQLASKDGTRPIGSGPFVLSEWTPDKQLVATKNPTYWRTDGSGNALPYLDRITFKPLPDASTRLAAIEAGDINLAMFNEASNVSRLLEDGAPEGTKMWVDESQGDEMTVVLNGQTGPTSDERIRKALQLTTDRDAIVAQYGSKFEVADGPYTNDNKWWSDSQWPAPDADQAKELVDDYMADNPGSVTITLGVLATPEFQSLAQLLQAQWSEAGIDVQIDAQDVAKYSAAVVDGQADALLLSFWNGEDPDIDYTYWIGKNIGPPDSISLNFARWSNAEIDRALDVGRSTSDESARKEAYATVWRQFAEHAPILWLYHVTWTALGDSRVQGIDAVDLPGGAGRAQPIIWGSVNLSNTWMSG
jgi:peptide/nickel transport system substrate-binding protein